MVHYETIFVYSPDFPQEKAANVTSKVQSIISDGGGKVLKIDEWGKRKLSYRISGHSEGVYVYMEHLSGGEAVAKMENMFRVTEGVLRYLTVKKVVSKRAEEARKASREKAEKRKIENSKPAESPAKDTAAAASE